MAPVGVVCIVAAACPGILAGSGLYGCVVVCLMGYCVLWLSMLMHRSNCKVNKSEFMCRVSKGSPTTYDRCGKLTETASHSKTYAFVGSLQSATKTITNHFLSLTDTAASASAILLQAHALQGRAHCCQYMFWHASSVTDLSHLHAYSNITHHFFSLTDTAASASAILLQCIQQIKSSQIFKSTR
jgi:hypothetical protein